MSDIEIGDIVVPFSGRYNPYCPYTVNHMDVWGQGKTVIFTHSSHCKWDNNDVLIVIDRSGPSYSMINGIGFDPITVPCEIFLCVWRGIIVRIAAESVELLASAIE